MKKYIIIFALFVSMSVYGQFNSGSVYFTGVTGANLGRELTEGGSSSIPYAINVEGGYFLKNRFSVGGNIYAHGHFGIETTGSHEIFMGPAFRYYLARESGIQIYFYGNPFYSVSTGLNTWGAAAGAGMNYFITEGIALEARGSYRYVRNYSEGFGYNQHSLTFEVGISIFFPSLTFFN